MFTGLFMDGLVISPQLEDVGTEIHWSAPDLHQEFRDINSTRLGISLGYLKRLNQQWSLWIDGKYSTGNVDTGVQHETRDAYFARGSVGGKSGASDLGVGFRYRWFNQRFHYATIMAGLAESENRWDTYRVVSFEDEGGLTSFDKSKYDTSLASRYLSVATEHVFPLATVGLRYRVLRTDLDGVLYDAGTSTKHDQSGRGSGGDWTIALTHSFNKRWDGFLNINMLDIDIDANSYSEKTYGAFTGDIQRIPKIQLEETTYTIGGRYIL